MYIDFVYLIYFLYINRKNNNMIEIWLKIEGLEDYAFSNYGRIYNYKKQEYSVGNLNKKTGYYEKLLFKDGIYFKGGGIHKFMKHLKEKFQKVWK